MIVGYNTITTGTQELFNTKCSNCGKKGAMRMFTFSNYFHIFLIPFCPYQKDGATHCSNCNQKLYNTQFSEELLHEYYQMKTDAKKAYWQFTGLVLFIIFIIAAICSIREDNKRDVLRLPTPQSGNIYEVLKKHNVRTPPPACSL